MSVIARGVNNAFRNGVRTTSVVIIIGLSVGLALTMLVARQAINQKIASVKASVGNTISISPAGSRGFQGGGTPLTAQQLASVKTVANVTSVTATLNDRLDTSDTNLVSSIDPGSLGQRFERRSNFGSTSNSDSAPGGGAPSASTGTGATATFNLPVTVIGTNTVSSATLQGGAGGDGTLKVTSGAAFDPAKDANVALVGASLATKNNLKVGSTFTAYGATITVVGTYDAGNAFSNAGIIMPLTTVQRLSAQTGAITSMTVTVNSVSNLDATTTAIKAQLGAAADVTSIQDAATAAISPLENIAKISLVSLVGALAAGSIIILLTMLMIVRERRREIGILKAIGSTNAKVMGQFMAEAVTFTSLGAIVGLGIGVLAASPVTKMLATSAQSAGTTPATMGGPGGFGGGRALRALGLGRDNLTALHAVVGWELLLYGLGVALVIAVIGSAIPSFLIAKVRPAEVMRAE